MPVKFQIRWSNDRWQPYYWRAVAGNHRVLCHSENYSNRQDARRAIDTVKLGLVTYEVDASTNGQWFFRVVARNGRTLARSETYYNRQDAVRAAELLRREAPNAPVEDVAA